MAEPSIHEQASWSADLEQLSEGFEPFRGAALNEMTPVDQAEFMAFVWSAVLKYRDIVQQIALEPVPEPVKSRKRTPKAQ